MALDSKMVCVKCRVSLGMTGFFHCTFSKPGEPKLAACCKKLVTIRRMAISVAVLVGDVAERLMPLLLEKTRALKVLNGTNLAAEMGPIVTAAAKQRITAYIDAG